MIKNLKIQMKILTSKFGRLFGENKSEWIIQQTHKTEQKIVLREGVKKNKSSDFN